MTITIDIEAHYPRDPDALFEQALTFADVETAMRGVATYSGFDNRGRFAQGDVITVDIWFWRLFPTRAHRITVERVDLGQRVRETRESHRGIRRWEHRLTVVQGAWEPALTGGPAGAVWRDHLILDAGWQTPMVGRFVQSVYRYGHRKRGAVRVRSRLTRSP